MSGQPGPLVPVYSANFTECYHINMHPNTLFRILVTSYSLSTFAEGIILPIYAIFVQQIGGDILDASGAVATFLIVSGVAEIVIHRLKWSQKNRTALMIGGWLVWVF